MNVDVYTLCWNEMAILPFVIETWKKFARHVYVFDNGSTDGSIEFLKKYGWITVEPFGNDTEKSNKQNRNIKNTKWKGSDADYVVVCDLDECLVGKDVIKALEDCKKNGVTVVETEWYNFVNPENKMPQYEEGKALYEICPYGAYVNTPKTLIFDPQKITEINYTVGAHHCSPRGVVKRCKPEGLYVHHINNALCLDYRLKRYEIQNARLSREDRQRGWGCHYGRNGAKISKDYNDELKKKIDFRKLLEGDINNIPTNAYHSTPSHTKNTQSVPSDSNLKHENRKFKTSHKQTSRKTVHSIYRHNTRRRVGRPLI